MESSRFSKRRNLLALFSVMAFGLFVIYMVDDSMEKNESEKRQSLLENVNRRSAIELSKSVDRFVYFVSDIRSYVRHAKDFPSQEELIEFVNKQIVDLEYKDSLIISYMDQDHVFRYSFTRTQIDPANLIGTSVRDFRDSASIERISAVMLDEDYHLFAPVNLVEGWVGIPLHFNIMRNGKSIGYLAAIADFKSIIDPIYSLESRGQFAFRFQVDDREFDRERVYDGTRVFNDRIDSLSFKNRPIAADQYVYSTFELHGLEFTIGTAYVDTPKRNQVINYILIGWIAIIGIFGVYAIYGINKFKTLSDSLELQKALLDQQNDQLNRLNETKDKFFSIIGHDLKSPLSSITSTVELWNTKPMPTEETDELIKRLETSTRGALRLLDNLLQWSLVNTGHLEKNVEDFLVKEVIDEVFSQLQTTASYKRINLETHVDPGLRFKGDVNMISTILRNLISNAIKYGKAASTVEVSVDKSDQEVVLKVTDQGPGIDADQMESLFDLNKRAVKKEGGTGLGLILVKEFVDAHQGKIQVDSNLGEGSVFIVSLPTGQ